MKRHLTNLFHLFKETYEEYQRDDVPRLSAALAYYTAFSLTPLLLVVIGIAGIMFDRVEVQRQVLAQISSLVGSEGAAVIEGTLQSSLDPATGRIATVIALITLIAGSGAVFGQLQSSLNKIWNVQPRPNAGLKSILRTLKTRFISLSMVLGAGFLLLVSLVLSTVIAALDTFLHGIAPQLHTLIQIANLVVSFGITTLLFAMIYMWLPDADIAWSDVWAGAAFTSVMFTLGKSLIGLYLGSSSVASAYGAAGSLIIILLWVYYSAQILFFGAEFTQVYSRMRGAQIRPTKDAVQVIIQTKVVDDPSANVAVATAPPVTILPSEAALIHAETEAAEILSPATPKKESRGWVMGFFSGIAAVIGGVLASLFLASREQKPKN